MALTLAPGQGNQSYRKKLLCWRLKKKLTVWGFEIGAEPNCEILESPSPLRGLQCTCMCGGGGAGFALGLSKADYNRGQAERQRSQDSRLQCCERLFADNHRSCLRFHQRVSVSITNHPRLNPPQQWYRGCWHLGCIMFYWGWNCPMHQTLGRCALDLKMPVANVPACPSEVSRTLWVKPLPCKHGDQV